MKGVLLVNLGSPDSPKPKDVKRYLGEFLMDERVIDVNPILRTILVKGIILIPAQKNQPKPIKKFGGKKALRWLSFPNAFTKKFKIKRTCLLLWACAMGR